MFKMIKAKMIKVKTNNSGFTLVEVIIAFAVLSIVFGIFATIISSVYTRNQQLSTTQANREKLSVSAEDLLRQSSGGGVIGDVKVKLNLSEAVSSEQDVNVDCKIVRGDYGDTTRGKYFYIYSGLPN